MLTDVIKVCEIEWQTDGEEVDLPDNVTIDIAELDAFELWVNRNRGPPEPT